MSLTFNPAKDIANRTKHGISLDRAQEMQVLARVEDHRVSEPRLRAYGTIDGKPYCLAYVLRDGVVRAISLRRARLKEMRRHVPGHGT